MKNEKNVLAILAADTAQCGSERVWFFDFLRSVVTGDECHPMYLFGKMVMSRL